MFITTKRGKTKTILREMAFQARGKPRGKGPKPPPGPPSLSLPPEILTMFQARPPIEHKSPIEKRKMPPLIGIGEYVDEVKYTTRKRKKGGEERNMILKRKLHFKSFFFFLEMF